MKLKCIILTLALVMFYSNASASYVKELPKPCMTRIVEVLDDEGSPAWEECPVEDGGYVVHCKDLAQETGYTLKFDYSPQTFHFNVLRDGDEYIAA
jgi:hypothetical protein